MSANMTVTMNARAKKLLDEALTLPEEDREEAWRVEIERRVKDVEEGRGVSYPVEESLARIREKLQPR